MKKKYLKNKVALLLVVTSLLSLAIVGVTVYLYITSTLTDSEKQYTLNSAKEQAHVSILTLKNNQLFVSMLSDQKLPKEFLLDRSEPKRLELLNIFSGYANKDKKFLSIYLLDKDGKALISTDPSFVGNNYSFRNYFKKAIKGEPSMDISIGQTSNQFGYYFASPVFGDKGDVLGILASKVDESDINTPIIESEIPKNNIIMLVDDFGVILYSNEPYRNLKSLGTLTIEEKNKISETRRFLDKEILPLQYDSIEQGIRDYKNPISINFYDQEDGDSEIINIIKLGKDPFYLVTETRLENLLGKILTTVLNVVVIVFITLILLSFIIYLFLRVFIRPLDRFKLFFENIGKGDFSEKINIKTGDEFEDLALSINNMADNLEGLYKNLDKKVKERTLKLEESEAKSKKSLMESERLNNAMVGRELEMINLKREIANIKNLPPNK